jgi:hypothetical protein
MGIWEYAGICQNLRTINWLTYIFVDAREKVWMKTDFYF